MKRPVIRISSTIQAKIITFEKKNVQCTYDITENMQV